MSTGRALKKHFEQEYGEFMQHIAKWILVPVSTSNGPSLCAIDDLALSILCEPQRVKIISDLQHKIKTEERPQLEVIKHYIKPMLDTFCTMRVVFERSQRMQNGDPFAVSPKFVDLPVAFVEKILYDTKKENADYGYLRFISSKYIDPELEVRCAGVLLDLASPSFPKHIGTFLHALYALSSIILNTSFNNASVHNFLNIEAKFQSMPGLDSLSKQLDVTVLRKDLKQFAITYYAHVQISLARKAHQKPRNAQQNDAVLSQSVDVKSITQESFLNGDAQQIVEDKVSLCHRRLCYVFSIMNLILHCAGQDIRPSQNQESVTPGTLKIWIDETIEQRSQEIYHLDNVEGFEYVANINALPDNMRIISEHTKSFLYCVLQAELLRKYQHKIFQQHKYYVCNTQDCYVTLKKTVRKVFQQPKRATNVSREKILRRYADLEERERKTELRLQNIRAEKHRIEQTELYQEAKRRKT